MTTEEFIEMLKRGTMLQVAYEDSEEMFLVVLGNRIVAKFWTLEETTTYLAWRFGQRVGVEQCKPR